MRRTSFPLARSTITGIEAAIGSHHAAPHHGRLAERGARRLVIGRLRDVLRQLHEQFALSHDRQEHGFGSMLDARRLLRRADCSAPREANRIAATDCIEQRRLRTLDRGAALVVQVDQAPRRQRRRRRAPSMHHSLRTRADGIASPSSKLLSSTPFVPTRPDQRLRFAGIEMLALPRRGPCAWMSANCAKISPSNSVRKPESLQ